MQLTIKTLKGQTFPVEVQPTQTILDLKNKIQQAKGFEPDSQKIVFKGKATVNTDQLQKLGVKEGDFLVIMTMVKKPEPKKQQPKKQQAPKQGEKKEEKPKQQKPKASQQKKQAPKQQSPQFQAKVNQLVSMGFPKDQCQKALRAAYNDSERAAQYLLSGNIPQNPPSQELPQNDMAEHVLAGIVNNPQFAQIKQLIRSNPAALQPILQQISQSSPQLYNIISQHPETFQRLIMQDGPQGGQGGQIPQMQPPPGSIMLTAGQQDAINRLRQLGFSKMDAAQAYLACDKNEQLAANYLFTRLDSGDIQMVNDFVEGSGSSGNKSGNSQGGKNQGGQDKGKNNENNDDDDNLFN